MQDLIREKEENIRTNSHLQEEIAKLNNEIAQIKNEKARFEKVCILF